MQIELNMGKFVRAFLHAVVVLAMMAISSPFVVIGFVVALVEDGYKLGGFIFKKTLKFWES